MSVAARIVAPPNSLAAPLAEQATIDTTPPEKDWNHTKVMMMHDDRDRCGSDQPYLVDGQAGRVGRDLRRTR
jgi:hypothetical protein